MTVIARLVFHLFIFSIMAKKIAGHERPYSLKEFAELILRIAKEQGYDFNKEAGLDYFIASGEKVLDSIEFYVVSETRYGSNEGIYTVFYAQHYDFNERRYVREEMATAKTCSADDDSYLAMHTMAARFETLAMGYVDKHQDEFTWKGYSVSCTKDGESFGSMYCPLHENAEKHAQELLQLGADAVTIRDNKTRKVTAYERK